MPVLYKSRLSILYLGLTVVGALLTGIWAYLIYRAEWKAAPGTSDSTAYYLGFGMLCLFSGFSLLCVTATLSIEQFELTSDSLYINRPLLFNKHRILLTDILRITSKDYQITSSHRNSTFTIYKGNKAPIHLANGEYLRFNSFETGDYYTCLATLQSALRRYKAKLNYVRL